MTRRAAIYICTSSTMQGEKSSPVEQETDCYRLTEQNGLTSEMAELIHADPQAPEERHQVFLLKKWIVDTVLAEVRINENRAFHLKFRTDFLG